MSFRSLSLLCPFEHLDEDEECHFPFFVPRGVQKLRDLGGFHPARRARDLSTFRNGYAEETVPVPVLARSGLEKVREERRFFRVRLRFQKLPHLSGLRDF